MDLELKLPDRVILHVGLPKAGSTAIQNALDAQRDSLLEQGVLFPRSVLRRSNPADPSRTPGHLDLLDNLVKNDIADFSAEIAEYSDQSSTLVLSIENMLLLGAADPKVQALASRLAQSEVTIIAVHRDPIDWYQAYYYECVVGGIRKTTEPPARHLTSTVSSGVFDFTKHLEALGELFKARHLHVLPFSTDQGLTLLERFLAVADMKLPEIAELSRAKVNVSFTTRPVVEAHRWLNLFSSSMPRAASLTFSQSMKSLYGNLLRDDPKLRGLPLLGAGDGIRLQQAVGSKDPLTTPRLPALRTASHRPAGAEVQAMKTIFQHGLDSIALKTGELRLSAPSMMKAGEPTVWPRNAASLLIREVGSARSIYVYDDTTALAIAAGVPGRLVFGVSASPHQHLSLQRAFDGLQPPSPILMRKDLQLRGAPRSVDLVVLGTIPSNLSHLAALRPATVICRVSKGGRNPTLPKEWNSQLAARDGGVRLYRCTANTSVGKFETI